MSWQRLYGRVLGLLGSDKRTGWWLAAGNLLLVCAVFAEPILFGRVIDVLISQTDDINKSSSTLWSSLSPLLIAWVLVGLFAIFSGVLVALFADRLAHARRHVVLHDYFEHVLELPLHHRDVAHSGRLLKIMLQGTDAMWSLWLSFFRDHLAAFLAVVVLMPVAVYLNWQMASLLILLSLVFVGMTVFVMRQTDALQRAVEGHYSALAEHVSDTLGNVALVQSFSRIQKEVGTLKGLSDQVIRAQFPALSWWAVITVLSRSATTFTVLAMLLMGLWLFSQGEISIGEIVTFIGFAGLIIGRLEQAVGFANRLSLEAPKLREFFEVMDLNTHVRESSNARDPGRLSGAISFQSVVFGYDPNRAAIDQLTVEIEPGQTVAVVGPSGAGKSTALALLYRLFDPQQGKILIDGCDIRDMTLSGLRQNIGVVFQETLLFNRSVAENLRVGLSEASDEQLRQAAHDACALSFIERLPEGFDSLVGERGRSLSGGERQRLSIARALLKDPPILILDEATSALDPQTEAVVVQAFDRARQDRTTLVIAHRLSTIRRADRVIVMVGGRMIESGTFDELRSKKGYFYDMLKTQFASEWESA
ncbi:MAG: glucan ABC transporter ATP-binding protein/ permease [Orrella sp.]